MAKADVIEQTKLRFGTWVVLDNNTQHAITVATNGAYSTSSSALVMLTPPQAGQYRITGLPAFHIVGNISIVMNYPMQSGGGPVFEIGNFTTQIADADALGETILYLGATAVTSGTNENYGDGAHEGEINIQINL